jgi:hypothetical protein
VHALANPRSNAALAQLCDILSALGLGGAQSLVTATTGPRPRIAIAPSFFHLGLAPCAWRSRTPRLATIDRPMWSLKVCPTRSRSVIALSDRCLHGVDLSIWIPLAVRGKDPSSTYLSGGPTRSWLKSKVRHEGRFVVRSVVERTEGWSEPVAGNDAEPRPELSGSRPFRSREATRGRTRKQRAGPLNIAILGTRTSPRRYLA